MPAIMPGNRVLIDLSDEASPSTGMVLVIRSDGAVGVLCDDGTVALARCERRAEIIRVATNMVLGHRLSRRHEPAVKVLGRPSLCATELLMDPAPLGEEEA